MNLVFHWTCLQQNQKGIGEKYSIYRILNFLFWHKPVWFHILVAWNLEKSKTCTVMKSFVHALKIFLCPLFGEISTDCLEKDGNKTILILNFHDEDAAQNRTWEIAPRMFYVWSDQDVPMTAQAVSQEGRRKLLSDWGMTSWSVRKFIEFLRPKD